MSIDRLVSLGLAASPAIPSLAGFTLRKTLIEHAIFQETVRTIARVHQRWRDTGVAEGLLVVAQTGAGKSTTLKFYRDQFPRYETPEGTQIPILYVATPESPSVRDLAEAVLDAFGDPAADKGSARAKTRRILNFVKKCGVQMIVIDEFHHFHDGNRQEAKRVSNWLKLLIEQLNIPVILAGLPRAIAVVNRNPELRRRFCAPFYLRPFGFKEADEKVEFRAVLKRMHSLVPGACECVSFHDEAMAERFFYASSGLIDYVVKIIDRAVSNTSADYGGKVTQECLEQAFKDAVWPTAPLILNPFNQKAKFRLLTKPGEPFDIWDDPRKYTSPTTSAKRRALTSANSSPMQVAA